MRKKTTLLFMVLLIFCATIIGSITFYFLNNFLDNQVESQLFEYIEIIGNDVDYQNGNYENLFDRYNKSIKLRISIIGKDGNVIADSIAAGEQKTLPIHSDRPEIIALRDADKSYVKRYSETAGDMLYYAAQIHDDGVIIRVSQTRDDVTKAITSVWVGFSIAIALSVVVCVFLAYLLSNRLTKPLAVLTKNVKEATLSTKISKLPIDVKISALNADETHELTFEFNLLADKINEQIDEIQRLEVVRSEFIANVTHELKTPLTSIRGFVETLKNGAINKPDVAERFLEIIEIEAVRLQNLINDILTLGQIEKIEHEDNVVSFNLNNLASQVEQLLLASAEKKHVLLRVVVHRDNIIVAANQDKIKQLLLNLISNAIEYNNINGEVWVHLLQEKGCVKIKVVDTGIGIEKEDVERIFERFYRVDKGRSRNSGGTGLGLSIVKHIVRLYDGNIKVYSTKGRGSEFVITLPIISNITI